ncbi:MAG: hypothetical protein WA667_22835, partial [Candidatus Nitrosopolaris sp.]
IIFMICLTFQPDGFSDNSFLISSNFSSDTSRATNVPLSSSSRTGSRMASKNEQKAYISNPFHNLYDGNTYHIFIL